jgi:hypothetical protein
LRRSKNEGIILHHWGNARYGLTDRSAIIGTRVKRHRRCAPSAGTVQQSPSLEGLSPVQPVLLVEYKVDRLFGL